MWMPRCCKLQVALCQLPIVTCLQGRRRRQSCMRRMRWKKWKQVCVCLRKEVSRTLATATATATAATTLKKHSQHRQNDNLIGRPCIALSNPQKSPVCHMTARRILVLSIFLLSSFSTRTSFPTLTKHALNYAACNCYCCCCCCCYCCGGLCMEALNL